ncbi:hypothetical protein OSCI_3800040 [Kamptonema sp. PCC 6506]|nr:hypothetical protein OSCI_3800040 [Kamptonema sp. PCC 6506]
MNNFSDIVVSAEMEVKIIYDRPGLTDRLNSCR